MSEYIPRRASRRDGPAYSKFIVALVILLNTAFAAAVLYIYLRVGSEPKTLITAWFAFTTGELFVLAGIKKKEIKEESNARPNNDGY